MRAVATCAVIAVLAGVAACGGNPRRDEALARAKAARARGDYVEEALALRDACTFARDDKKLCTQAGQAWYAAHAAATQVARAACGTMAPTQEATDACLREVTQLRKLDPNDVEAARLAEVASRQHLARCFADSPAWQTSIDAAVELVRCQDARAQQIRVPIYAQQVESSRVETREQVLRLADHPAYTERLGARAELLAAATCLAPIPDLVERARAGRTAFVDRARASIDLRATTSTPLPELCVTAAGALAGRAVCGSPRPGAPHITIVGDVALAPVEHSAHETTETKQYVAGIIRFENPQYQPAVNEERNTRQARDQAESTYRRDESDCRSAESALSSAQSCSGCPQRDERDRACNRKSASESLYRSRTSDWESANRRLSSTSPMSEREDIRTARYTVRHHTWRTAWRAQFRSDGQTTPSGGDTSASDRETSGAPVAGVPADPMTHPGSRWFVPRIRDQVAAKIAEAADAALRRRSSDLAISCGEPHQWSAEWLDCWARVRFWGGAPPAPDALLRLVGDHHDRTAKTAPAWQPLRCRI